MASSWHSRSRFSATHRSTRAHARRYGRYRFLLPQKTSSFRVASHFTSCSTCFAIVNDHFRSGHGRHPHLQLALRMAALLVQCTVRRFHVYRAQHKSNTILTPCLQCSDDTPLHQCNTDGYSFHLCKLCLKCRGNITSDSGMFEITDNIAFHGFISTTLLLLRSFGNGLYRASSDTGVIAATAMFALHPVHTVTVLAFLVSSSSICSACMQLVHTLSYPVFLTVSQIVDMRKRSIQQNTYGKFIRRAKTVVMAALTALTIIATTSYRVTSSATTWQR